MYAQELFDKFTNILGDGHVIADSMALDAAAATNYPTTQQIPLILYPSNTKELSDCIILANEYRRPVYVVSKGKNWGYGSRVPVQDGSILIGLGRMNQISGFDEQLGYMTIEPGVTFQQAFEFLREKQSELLLSTTGGATDSSIIGNALERGIGTGLYADRFSAICGMEVVLPDGRVINTGFERFDHNTSGKLSRWGVGPSLDGLFTQSNLGIVTRMTIWLMKCSASFHLAFYKIDGLEQLGAVINVLQEMSMDGLVRPALTLYNDLRVLSSIMQFPFHETTPGAMDPDALLAHIRATSPLGGMVGEWNGEISVRSASQAHGELQCQLIRERMEHLVYDLTFISVSRDEIMHTLDEHYKHAGRQQGTPTLKSFLLGKYIGIPSNAAIGQIYWRKRKPVPAVMDPDADKCGMFWFCPVLPFRGSDIMKAVEIIKSTAKKYTFEAAISFQCLSERSIHIISSINWDREFPGEDRLAEDCYRETKGLLDAAGYYAYRDATLDMEQDRAEDAYGTLLLQLKNTMDPNHILSPGKYIPIR